MIVAGFGLEKAGLRAHILGMKNRIGWTTCHSIGGKYAVAELLEGGIVGNGLITFATKEEAQKFIDSGKADALAARGAGVEPKDRK